MTYQLNFKISVSLKLHGSLLHSKWGVRLLAKAEAANASGVSSLVHQGAIFPKFCYIFAGIPVHSVMLCSLPEVWMSGVGGAGEELGVDLHPSHQALCPGMGLIHFSPGQNTI